MTAPWASLKTVAPPRTTPTRWIIASRAGKNLGFLEKVF